MQTRAVSKCTLCLSCAASILNDYIPTFRFGVLSTCRAVTISINPAENVHGRRPLPRLGDYGVTDRRDLKEEHLSDISRRSDEYFAHGTKHRFFNTLASVVASIDQTWTYETGTLSHVDLVACVTRPTWANGVPEEDRSVMLRNCRPHFLNTLRLLPPDCWLLCDGKTALQAIEAAGGLTAISERVAKITISLGTLVFDSKEYRYVGWSRPAHKLYASPNDVGSKVKRLIGSRSDGSKAVRIEEPPAEAPASATNGLSFASQRDLMRFLVRTLGQREDVACREYAEVERRGRVPRTSDKYSLSPEQYAHRLYRDGIRKGWL